MTAAPTSRAGTAGQVRTLAPGEESSLRSLLAADPLEHCFVDAKLRPAGLRASSLGGYVLGYYRAGRLVSAAYVGANLVPIATDEVSRRELARHLVRVGRRSSSIVGPADEVIPLWSLLQPYWGNAREVRAEQPLLEALAPPSVRADPRVRRTVPDELGVVLPACIEMFTEEVGVSPLAGGAGPAYSRRVAELIESGRSFARLDGGQPVFKAELGAVTPQACQVQGVWVHPDHRGHGLGSSGMAAVVALARQDSPRVSLYVNSYNAPAMRAYELAGFRRVGTFATVLF